MEIGVLVSGGAGRIKIIRLRRIPYLHSQHSTLHSYIAKHHEMEDIYMNLEREIAHDLLSIGAVFLRPDEPFTWASGIRAPSTATTA